jgi:hypothetical protein
MISSTAANNNSFVGLKMTAWSPAISGAVTSDNIHVETDSASQSRTQFIDSDGVNFIGTAIKSTIDVINARRSAGGLGTTIDAGGLKHETTTPTGTTGPGRLTLRRISPELRAGYSVGQWDTYNDTTLIGSIDAVAVGTQASEGKWIIYARGSDGAFKNMMEIDADRGLMIPQQVGTTTAPSSAMWQIDGPPSYAVGSNGDYVFRTTDTANGAYSHLYFKNASGWAPIYDQPLSVNRGDPAGWPANTRTLVVNTDAPVQMFSTTFTANGTIVLPTVGMQNGTKFRIVRTGLGAFTLDVGGLKTLPAGTAAWCEVAHDGAAWKLIGYGTL